MLLDEIIDELRHSLKGKKVVNNCIGVAYTSVMLSDGSLGISHTVTEGENSLCGEVFGNDAVSLVESLKNSPIERSVSVAILNSVGNIEGYENGDPIDVLEGNKLCVFGYSPGTVTNRFVSVTIYDFWNPPQRSFDNVTVKPFSSFTSETCDSTVIFGSALVVGNIEKILASISTDHLILSGISSVYAPITLKKYGFDYIGKVIAVDKIKALRVVCEGGLAKHLSRFTKKVYVKL
ncbi:hypothetical protein SUSAZ_11070 [Sulfolobus acidocaldarius SUSAZ]|nr:hypothetical protein SUSAZ_11070 [Sulfolobus acidocaldarius SUSAZ]